MSKEFTNLNISPAVSNRSRIDLSRQSIGTMNIGEIVPIFTEACVPSDSISVNGNIFARLEPLVVPTFGSLNIKTATFFVPYYQVFDEFDAWVSGMNMVKGRVPVLPRICFATIVNFLLRYCDEFTESDIEADDISTDFSIYSTESGESTYYRFTPKGKHFYTIFRMLGYNLPQGMAIDYDDHYNFDGFGAPDYNKGISALPLLCFFKAYYDHMYNCQYYNNTDAPRYLNDVRNGNVPLITEEKLDMLFLGLQVYYSSDYFTSAWETPSTPSLNPYNATSYTDKMGNKAELVFGQVKSGVLNNQITQNSLDILRAFDKWTRRNSYVGTKALDQIRARFGLKPEDYDVEFCHLINTSSSPISVGDVTSTAQTAEASLGEYAGKGIGNGGMSCDYKSDDYGHFIIFSWIEPEVIYADGVNRECLKTTPTDFYTPEYDGVGVNAIPMCEVGQALDVPYDEEQPSMTDVFGYTEKYNEYRTKASRSRVFGDMSLPHTHVGYDAWHFNRSDIGTLFKIGDLRAQALDFLTLDGNDFNRIFTTSSDAFDKFNVQASFGVTMSRPMKNINDVAELGEGGLAIEKNGRTIS